ncbi:S-adenosyl-L-methionine-dependent methyltransferase [Phytophthora cactorum]|nr:S-adenosyl-L-methionine-dependent methyltransferase [Phytophthora cactorum]
MFLTGSQSLSLLVRGPSLVKQQNCRTKRIVAVSNSLLEAMFLSILKSISCIIADQKSPVESRQRWFNRRVLNLLQDTFPILKWFVKIRTKHQPRPVFVTGAGMEASSNDEAAQRTLRFVCGCRNYGIESQASYQSVTTDAEPTLKRQRVDESSIVEVRLVEFIRDLDEANEDNNKYYGSLLLSRFVAHEASWLCRDKVVLELGCGTGLPSILSGLCGATKVYLTDRPDVGDTQRNAEANITLNGLEGCAEYIPLTWGDMHISDEITSILRTVQVILAADCFYQSEVAQLPASSILPTNCAVSTDRSLLYSLDGSMMFARVARVASLTAVRRTPSMGLHALQTREKASLVNVLKREIEEEKANCFEEQELENLRLKVEKVFSLQETPGCMDVVLQGTVGADSIKIKFNAQDTVELEEDEDYDDEDEEDESNESGDDEEFEEEEEDELPGIRFTADITRDNKGMQFDCVASSNLTVERLRYLKDFAKEAEDETLYFGPNFIDLELDAQDKFYEYLAERNIDDELAQFITQFADYKEQREYLAFLEDTETFVKH